MIKSGEKRMLDSFMRIAGLSLCLPAITACIATGNAKNHAGGPPGLNSVNAVELYVSPKGNDQFIGTTAEKPLASLAAARDADGALRSVTKALSSNELHIGALGFRVFVLLALERPADAKEQLLVGCMCNGGKHRSVGMAWFVDRLLKHLGHESQVWSMNHILWDKHISCGRNPCSECDEETDLKYKLGYRIYRI